VTTDSPHDWEAIEREYRAGQLSLREIGRQRGISDTAIRKRAKAEGWTRALAERVREQVRETLVRADGSRAGSRATREHDAEIIEAAADRGMSVVMSHRRDITRLSELRTTLADRLASYLSGDTLDGPALGEKESPAELLERLSRVTARIIPLERQAYGLDAPEAVDPRTAPTVPTMEELRARKLEWARAHGGSD